MKIPLSQYLKLLSRYLAAQKPRVALLFVLLLAGMLLQVGNPQIVRVFIDGALEGKEQSDLVLLAGLFITVAAFSQVIAVVATYLSEKVGWTATNALRSDFAEHLLRLDMSFHKTRTPGEMIQRIDGDIDGLSNFFSQFAAHWRTVLPLPRRLAAGRGTGVVFPIRAGGAVQPALVRHPALDRPTRGHGAVLRLRRRAIGGHGRHPRQRGAALLPHTLP